MLENEGCCAVTFPGEAAANNVFHFEKNPSTCVCTGLALKLKFYFSFGFILGDFPSFLAWITKKNFCKIQLLAQLGRQEKNPGEGFEVLCFAHGQGMSLRSLPLARWVQIRNVE